LKVVPKKCQQGFFHEVAAGAERIIKRATRHGLSIPADIQNRGDGGRESPEGTGRAHRAGAGTQHIFKRNMLRPQLCTKCGINRFPNGSHRQGAGLLR